MKANIHPKWTHDAVVTCSCGNTFTTGSQQPTLQVDICNKCHPFFTGEVRFVDRQGRVDKFMQKMSSAKTKQAAAAAKRAAKDAVPAVPEDEVNTSNEPISYKQVLQREQNKMKSVAKSKQTAAPVAVS